MMIKDPKETLEIVTKDPMNWVEFTGVYRTQEFIDTMIHRVPDASIIMRVDFIKKYCKDKKVLHLGCRGHSKDPNPMHGELDKICSELWGVDIQECDIPNFVLADLDGIGWHELIWDKFDILLATEIMEHLGNPGIFLDECRQFDCEVLLTVPNAYCHSRHSLMRKGFEYDNFQHVACYSFHTVQTLTKRYGFDIIEFHWADSPMQYYSRGLVFVLAPV